MRRLCNREKWNARSFQMQGHSKLALIAPRLCPTPDLIVFVIPLDDYEGDLARDLSLISQETPDTLL
jgi:hypothetical protein